MLGRVLQAVATGITLPLVQSLAMTRFPREHGSFQPSVEPLLGLFQAVVDEAQHRVRALGHGVIVHDELDIEPGTIRVKFGGGHAGHNGLRSICDKRFGKAILTHR